MQFQEKNFLIDLISRVFFPGLFLNFLAHCAGSVLIDACAAPGMKTSQALANIYPDGKCIAVERNAKRFKTLNDLLDKHNAVDVNNTNIETIREDFLQMNPDEYSNVVSAVTPRSDNFPLDMAVSVLSASTKDQQIKQSTVIVKQ